VGCTLAVRPTSSVDSGEPSAHAFGVGVFDGFTDGRNLASVPSLPGGKQLRRRPLRYSLAKGRLGREREVQVLYF
jgi:hypothetical protein